MDTSTASKSLAVQWDPHDASLGLAQVPHECTVLRLGLEDWFGPLEVDAEIWRWAKISPPGYGPQVLVHVSTSQGNLFWAPIFDPQPYAANISL